MEEEMKKLAYRLEGVQAKAEKLHSLHIAVGAALFHQGTYAITNFEWAYCLMGDMTHEFRKELDEMKDYAFAAFRKGGERLEAVKP